MRGCNHLHFDASVQPDLRRRRCTGAQLDHQGEPLFANEAVDLTSGKLRALHDVVDLRKAAAGLYAEPGLFRRLRTLVSHDLLRSLLLHHGAATSGKIAFGNCEEWSKSKDVFPTILIGCSGGLQLDAVGFGGMLPAAFTFSVDPEFRAHPMADVDADRVGLGRLLVRIAKRAAGYLVVHADRILLGANQLDASLQKQSRRAMWLRGALTCSIYRLISTARIQYDCSSTGSRTIHQWAVNGERGHLRSLHSVACALVAIVALSRKPPSTLPPFPACRDRQKVTHSKHQAFCIV